MKRLFIHLLLLGMITNGSLAIAGPTIVVKNPLSLLELKLSDLKAFDNAGNSKVILERGNAADDVTLQPGQIKDFQAGFEVKKIEISRIFADGTERDTVLFDVFQLTPIKVGFLENPDPSGQDVFLAIDHSQFNFDPPTEGTILSFANGLNPTLPGWFVGTAIDFDQGIISNPYTGSAEILAGFEVTTVPEPETYALMLAGLGLVGFVARRRERWGIAGNRRRSVSYCNV